MHSRAPEQGRTLLTGRVFHSGLWPGLPGQGGQLGETRGGIRVMQRGLGEHREGGSRWRCQRAAGITQEPREQEGEREGAETRGRRRGQGRSAEAGVSAAGLAGVGGLPPRPAPAGAPGTHLCGLRAHPSGHGTPRPARHVALRHDQA